VLFVDLVGFTPLSETRDPEAVRELLSTYFEHARTVIGRYGGVVEKFIGDAVMAVWGAPVAAEGDAERAVRAALELVEAVAQLGAESGIPGLRARAGVVTGEVAVTLGATSEGMVAGDAVNTAARVQAAASPHSVLVDGATQRLASAAIEFVDAGEHVLKGKSEPARLWQAIRVVSGVGGSQRVDGLEAPLTGRDAELRTIKELFHASTERRSPRLVLVCGPAGVGKSRLGWEFEKYIDGLAESMYWHRGRCLSYGEGVAFWALAQIVRQRFAIAEEDTEEAAAAKLAARLPDFVRDEAERLYVGPRLGRLLGVTYSADATATSLSREELFAGWRLFFERLADVQPVILLIEDAQHADPALLEFLDHLIDWARTAPIYVLVFGRPELQERRPGWAAGRNRTGLTLDPLDARSMDTLVEALVPGMPSAAVAAIARHAQGNPLFAVETVRSLIDRDAIVPIDGVYRLVGDIGALAVPDSLHALLAARLDALDPQLRVLVGDAAVLGTSFPPEALIAVSGRDAAQVEAGLTELLHRGVLEISADPLSPQRGSYQFSQNLLRQVAYETLSRRDRKARHLAVAAHLRATFANEGEEVSEVVARHYLDALAAVPDDADADDLRARAIAALVRAAQRAVQSGAPSRAAATFAEAAALTEQASSLGTELAAARLWEHAAEAAGAAPDFDNSIACADRAATLYAAHEQPRAAARAQVASGAALRRAGRHAEGRTRVDEAMTVLRADSDRDTVVGMLELATAETFAGGPDAHRLASEALALGQALDVGPERMCELFIIRGLAAGVQNRYAEAAADLEYAARLAERAGYTFGRSRALLNLSSWTLGTDPVGAAAAGRTAAEGARQRGDRYYLPTAVANHVVALLLTGEWDEAENVLRHAVDDEGLSDESLSSAYVAIYAAILPALRGDVAAADGAVASMAAMRTSEDPQDLASANIVDAFCAAARNESAEALRHARAALAHAPALGVSHECVLWSWPLAARTAHDLGDTTTLLELLAVLDEYPVGHVPPLLRAERSLARARFRSAAGDSQADPAFASAITELRAIGSQYHLAHALLDQAEHLNASGDPASAVLVEEACEIAAKLGARPLLDRVTAVARFAPAAAS
jgi:class 3 adenylate cyclase/tetratricopeptide (TPR) repeat protein